MRLALKPHPDSVCAAVTAIAVEATRPRPGALALRYVVTGTMAGIVLPARAEPLRTDGLWAHTCLEAFVRGTDGEAYREFNFSPSTQWAAYRFDGYRQGMTPELGIAAPRIDLSTTEAGFELRAALDLDGLAGLADDAPWRLGLTAVIEEVGGRVSHWALAHPSAKADFHHAGGFVLEVSPEDRR